MMLLEKAHSFSGATVCCVVRSCCCFWHVLASCCTVAVCLGRMVLSWTWIDRKTSGKLCSINIPTVISGELFVLHSGFDANLMLAADWFAFWGVPGWALISLFCWH